MRVILHNGMPKSGTTALQKALLKHKRLLLEDGILYPAGKTLPKNHNILVTGVSSYERLPRIYKQIYKDDPGKRDEDFSAVVRDISEAAQSNKVHTVVLSSEMLFRRLDPEQIKTLSTALHSIGDKVEVITYVRHPADYYLSMMQQSLAASSKLRLLASARYRHQIESYADIADTQIVAHYDRAALQGGDITHDFFNRLLPDHTGLLKRMQMGEHNVSSSAEAIDILHRYRKYVHSNADGTFTRDTGTVRTYLQSLDRAVEGYSRPILTPDAYEIVCQSAIDLPWLLETYGIQFENVDYNQEFKELRRPVEPASVDQVCQVNQERRDRLLMALVQQLTGKAEAMDVRFRIARPKTVPPPRRSSWRSIVSKLKSAWSGAR